MRSITFENIFNHEHFVCDNIKDVELIDGVEFLKVHRHGHNRTVLMRKDSLKKIEVKKNKLMPS